MIFFSICNFILTPPLFFLNSLLWQQIQITHPRLCHWQASSREFTFNLLHGHEMIETRLEPTDYNLPHVFCEHHHEAGFADNFPLKSEAFMFCQCISATKARWECTCVALEYACCTTNSTVPCSTNEFCWHNYRPMMFAQNTFHHPQKSHVWCEKVCCCFSPIKRLMVF